VRVVTNKAGPKIRMLSIFTFLASLCDVTTLTIEPKRPPPPVEEDLVEVVSVWPRVVPGGGVVAAVAADAGPVTETDVVAAAAPVGTGAPS
jgi:hypothetical protein